MVQVGVIIAVGGELDGVVVCSRDELLIQNNTLIGQEVQLISSFPIRMLRPINNNALIG